MVEAKLDNKESIRMNLDWKYVEPLDEKQLSKIEKHFGLSLPEDYKKLLVECNRGKPTLERFDTELQKECVLDYMIDLEETVATAQAIPPDNLIPIGSDPFGNFIAFKIADERIDSVVFWEHERDEVYRISSSFTEFWEKLY